MKIETIEIEGEGLAKVAAKILIGRSAWFEMTPLPDDKWAFQFKPEGHKEAIQKEIANSEPPKSSIWSGPLELNYDGLTLGTT